MPNPSITSGGSGGGGGSTTEEEEDSRNRSDTLDPSDDLLFEDDTGGAAQSPDDAGGTDRGGRTVADTNISEPETAVSEGERETQQFEEAGGQEPENTVSTLEDAEEIGGDATTAADRELQRGEQRERVRESVAQQLEAQGIDTDRVDISVERTEDGFEASATASDEEQFGDIDFSAPLDALERETGVDVPFGGDPDTDEVEQFVDEDVGEQGSELVEQNVSDPLRDAGEDAREADPFADENMPTDVTDVREQFAVDPDSAENVGPGQAAGNLAIATANIGEEIPQLPAVGLEAIEGTNFLLEATPIAGGSEEQFDERAGQVGEFAQFAAQQSAQRAQANPGPFAAEFLIGAGASRAVTATSTGARAASAFNGAHYINLMCFPVHTERQNPLSIV